MSSDDAAAATFTIIDDAEMARRLATIEQLMTLFGFSQAAAEHAVDSVGCTDLTVCYNFILDQGMGQDNGGPIYPKMDCPHIERHVLLTELPHQPHLLPCQYHAKRPAQGLAKEELHNGSCPAGENWLCLECGIACCSRYVNAHGVAHWKDTQDESSPEGHCLAVSMADLSVWCHICSAYCQDPVKLDPIVRRLEKLKFEKDEKKESENEFEERSSHDKPAAKRPKLPDDDDNVEEENLENIEQVERSSDNEESNQSTGSPNRDTVDISLDGLPGDALMSLLSAAAARGIPLDYLLQQFDDSDDEDVEYPFEEAPSSLKDVARFIQSDKCRKILILAGAGMSVSSGIPDYRSSDGFYATMNVDELTADPVEREAIREDPSRALQQDCFLENPLPCLELKRDFILGASENRWKATLAHRFVELLHSKTNKLCRMYTMNIDGLENQCTDLPPSKVIAVHGTMGKAECASCQTESNVHEFYGKVKNQIKDLTKSDPSAPSQSTPITCSNCGKPHMKPAIVLFRSKLPDQFFNSVPTDIEDVDLLLILGTSLQVAPANSLVWRVPRSCMRLLINRESVGEHLGLCFDGSSRRDYHAEGDCDDVVLELIHHLGWLRELEPLAANSQLPVPVIAKIEGKLRQTASDG